MKSAILAIPVLMSTLAVAHGQQQPSGPSLDFTLNYINSSLKTGTVSLEGSTLTWSFYVWHDGDQTKAYYSMDLMGAKAFSLFANQVAITCPSMNQQNLSNCSHQYQVDGQTGQKTYGESQNALDLEVDTNGNSFKVNDVVNAVNHLIAFVTAQHNADLQHQQQQNQSDPFASPQ
jgi:hypothetical protein